MNNTKLESAIRQALTAPAAPAELVDKVFAQTTRRKSWWARYKMALAGGVAAVVVAVCVGVGSYVHNASLSQAEFAAYISQTQNDEYALFLSDLDLFEQEF